MAPNYTQNTAKSSQIHTTVDLPFKRPLHTGYNLALHRKYVVHAPDIHKVAQRRWFDIVESCFAHEDGILRTVVGKGGGV